MVLIVNCMVILKWQKEGKEVNFYDKKESVNGRRENQGQVGIEVLTKSQPLMMGFLKLHWGHFLVSEIPSMIILWGSSFPLISTSNIYTEWLFLLFK